MRLKRGISALFLAAGLSAVLYLGVQEDAKMALQVSKIDYEDITETEQRDGTEIEENSKEKENDIEQTKPTVEYKCVILPAKEKTEEADSKEEVLAADESAQDEDETVFDAWDEIEVYEASKMLYAQSNVNVRKGPDTIYDVLGKLATNDTVEVIGNYKLDNWYEIKYQDEVAFVSGKYLGEEQIDLEALRIEQEAAAMAAIEADLQRQQAEAEKAAQTAAAPATPQAETAAPAQEQAAPAPAPFIASPAGVVFVGDSRCVQMQAAVGGGGSTWICEGGKRVSWMEENAVPRLDNIVGKGTKVVICMGVNDPWHYPEYAALTNRKAAEWNARGATVYFVSVNPVWENPYVTQEQVDTFNANLPGLLSGVRWIDTASIVKQGGYKLVDGLHYDTSAYINIFNLICGSL